MCVKRERGVGGRGKVEGEGLKELGAHGWADSWPPLGFGCCGHGLWLLGDWKVCQAQ